MATTGTLWSAEEFDMLPVEEGRRFELLEGEVIELSSATPRHNGIQARLIISAGPHLLTTGGCVWAGTEFALGSDRYQPDVAIYADGRWKQWNLDRVPVGILPDIVVEIISPSETANHVDTKTRTYLRHGVKEVWAFYSTESPHMLVHRQGTSRTLEITDTLSTPLLPGWSVSLREIFEIVQ